MLRSLFGKSSAVAPWHTAPEQSLTLGTLPSFRATHANHNKHQWVTRPLPAGWSKDFKRGELVLTWKDQVGQPQG